MYILTLPNFHCIDTSVLLSSNIVRCCLHTKFSDGWKLIHVFQDITHSCKTGLSDVFTRTKNSFISGFKLQEALPGTNFEN